MAAFVLRRFWSGLSSRPVSPHVLLHAENTQPASQPSASHSPSCDASSKTNQISRNRMGLRLCQRITVTFLEPASPDCYLLGFDWSLKAWMDPRASAKDEREERGWWTLRCQQVIREFQCYCQCFRMKRNTDKIRICSRWCFITIFDDCQYTARLCSFHVSAFQRVSITSTTISTGLVERGIYYITVVNLMEDNGCCLFHDLPFILIFIPQSFFVFF